jgi:hypothetical protein
MHPIEMRSEYNGDTEELQRNREYSRSLGNSTEMPRGEGTLVIVAGGPSLKDSLEDVRGSWRVGDKILACNGAHKFLVSNGITPWACMIVDKNEENWRFVAGSNPGTIYLLASSCHPRVFIQFNGLDRDVRVWDMITNVEEIESDGQKVEDGRIMAAREGYDYISASGSTVAIHALLSGFNMGFRNFEIFGMDSCVAGDKHHAYSQKWNDGMDVWPEPVFVGARSFICEPWMILQAQDFQKIIRVLWPHIGLKVHGDGMIAAILDEGARVHEKWMNGAAPQEPYENFSRPGGRLDREGAGLV